MKIRQLFLVFLTTILFIQCGLAATPANIVSLSHKLGGHAEDLVSEYWMTFLAMKSTSSQTGKYMALEFRLGEIEDSIRKKGFEETDLRELATLAEKQYEKLKYDVVELHNVEEALQLFLERVQKEGPLGIEELSHLLKNFTSANPGREEASSIFLETLKFHASKMTADESFHYIKFSSKIWVLAQLSMRQTVSHLNKIALLEMAAKDFVGFMLASAAAHAFADVTESSKNWKEMFKDSQFYQKLIPAFSEILVAANFEFDTEMLEIFNKENKSLSEAHLKVNNPISDVFQAIKETFKVQTQINWIRTYAITGLGVMMTLFWTIDNLKDRTPLSWFTITLVTGLWAGILFIVKNELGLISNTKWFFMQRRKLSAQNKFAKAQMKKLLAVVSDAKLCRMAAQK